MALAAMVTIIIPARVPGLIQTGTVGGAVTVKLPVSPSTFAVCSPSDSVTVKKVVVESPPSRVIVAVSFMTPFNSSFRVYVPISSPMFLARARFILQIRH